MQKYVKKVLLVNFVWNKWQHGRQSTNWQLTLAESREIQSQYSRYFFQLANVQITEPLKNIVIVRQYTCRETSLHQLCFGSLQSSSIWRRYCLVLKTSLTNDATPFTSLKVPAVNLTMSAGNAHNTEKKEKRSTTVFSFIHLVYLLALLFKLNHNLFIWIEYLLRSSFFTRISNFLLGREVWQYVLFAMKTWDSWFFEWCVIFFVYRFIFIFECCNFVKVLDLLDPCFLFWKCSFFVKEGF